MNNWQDGITFEAFERQQRANRYSDEGFIDREREYRVDWINSEFEDTEFITASDEEEAEELAMDRIPADAIIINVRVA